MGYFKNGEFWMLRSINAVAVKWWFITHGQWIQPVKIRMEREQIPQKDAQSEQPVHKFQAGRMLIAAPEVKHSAQDHQRKSTSLEQNIMNIQDSAWGPEHFANQERDQMVSRYIVFSSTGLWVHKAHYRVSPFNLAAQCLIHISLQTSDFSKSSLQLSK